MKYNRNIVVAAIRIVPIFAALAYFFYFNRYYLDYSFLGIQPGSVGSGVIFAVSTFIAVIIALINDGAASGLFDAAVGTAVIIEFMCVPLFGQFYPEVLVVIFGAEAILACALSAVIVYANSKRMAPLSALKKARPKAVRLLVRILCVVLIVPSIFGVYDHYYKNSISRGSLGRLSEQYSVRPSDFACLNDWYELGTEAKEFCIRRIAENERDQLGISSEIKLLFNEQDTTLAFYDDYGKYIAYDRRILENRPMQVCVNAIIHEMHHAYVHEVVDSVNWSSVVVYSSSYYDDARRWRDSIENYVSAEKDFDAYYDTAIEVDARAYAEERTEYYIELAQAYARSDG